MGAKVDFIETARPAITFVPCPVVDAFAIVSQDSQELHLLLVNAEFPAPESRAYIALIKKRIKEKRLGGKVTILNDYLSNKDSIAYLQRADLIVIPYQNTTESSSGSARMALASRRPVAVTELAIFDDMRSAVITLPGTSPEELAEGIIDTLKKISMNDPSISSITNNAHLWMKAHGFSGVGRYLFSMLLEMKEFANQNRLPL